MPFMIFIGVHSLMFDILTDTMLDAHLLFFFVFDKEGGGILRTPWQLRRRITRHSTAMSFSSSKWLIMASPPSPEIPRAFQFIFMNNLWAICSSHEVSGSFS
jgi:hypothetical protein